MLLFGPFKFLHAGFVFEVKIVGGGVIVVEGARGVFLVLLGDLQDGAVVGGVALAVVTGALVVLAALGDVFCVFVWWV